MSGNTQQARLQLALALLLVLIIFLVEWVAVKPKGVYIHTRTPAGPFAPGMDRKAVLDKVNTVKAIREILTCEPASRTGLTSRVGFALSPDMAESRTWILKDRKAGVYWLGFRAGKLDLVLFLNEPDDNAQKDFLSLACQPELFESPAAVIPARTSHRVFPD